VTNAFNAEQGNRRRRPPSDLTIAKSGTNQYHGTGWIFNQTSYFKARNFFQSTPQNPKNIHQPVRSELRRAGLHSQVVSTARTGCSLAELGADHQAPDCHSAVLQHCSERPSRRGFRPPPEPGTYSSPRLQLRPGAPDTVSGNRIPSARFDLAAVEMIEADAAVPPSRRRVM